MGCRLKCCTQALRFPCFVLTSVHTFTSRIYDPFWRVAQELAMPIGLHILTGHGAPSRRMPAEQGPIAFLTGLVGPQALNDAGLVTRSWRILWP